MKNPLRQMPSLFLAHAALCHSSCQHDGAELTGCVQRLLEISVLTLSSRHHSRSFHKLLCHWLSGRRPFVKIKSTTQSSLGDDSGELPPTTADPEEDNEDDSLSVEDIPDGDLAAVSAGFLEQCKMVRPTSARAQPAAHPRVRSSSSART